MARPKPAPRTLARSKPAARKPAPRPAPRPAPKPAPRPAPRMVPKPTVTQRAAPAALRADRPKSALLVHHAGHPAPHRPQGGPRAVAARVRPAKPAARPKSRPGAQRPAERRTQPRTGAHAGRPKPAEHQRPVRARAAAGAWSGSTAQRTLWQSQLARSVKYTKIPWWVAWGVYGEETNWGRYIGTSSTGAQGLMQFEPDTAAAYHYPLTNHPDSVQSQQQFTAACLYLRDLEHEHGSWDAALRAYSGGGYGAADVAGKAGDRKTAPPAAVKHGGTAKLYYNPLAYADVSPERIDQGVDYAVQGGYLVAIADGQVGIATNTMAGWPGGYVVYRITQPGPLNGVCVYYAEGVSPVVHDGEQVRGGARIANLRAGWGTGIEVGFAADLTSGRSWASEHGGWNDIMDGASDATRAGIAMSDLIKRLGGPPGKVEGPTVGQWPPWHATSLLAAGSLAGHAPSPIPSNILTIGSANSIVTQDDSSGLITGLWSALDKAFHAGWVTSKATHEKVSKTVAITTKG